MTRRFSSSASSMEAVAPPLGPLPYVMALESGQSVTLQSKGLLTGKHVQATLRLPASTGQGVVFIINGQRLPATLANVADAQRGITLLEPTTRTPLSIVEHLLAAVSLSGQHDLDVLLCDATAPDALLTHAELPLLDGSAWPWFEAIRACFGVKAVVPRYRITKRCWLPLGGRKWILAEPFEGLKLTYALNYPHEALKQTWGVWQHTTLEDEANLYALLGSATFGEVAELPALQAKGMALGVDATNTVGLLEDNVGFTRPLHHVAELHHHKSVDFMGDCFLAGKNLSHYQGAFTCLYTGHLAFAQTPWPCERL
ncbi:MAG: UDP-3-O-acyl-N-acetylglucosamine deacetylase [Vampirovibrionales bacterium]